MKLFCLAAIAHSFTCTFTHKENGEKEKKGDGSVKEGPNYSSMQRQSGFCNRSLDQNERLFRNRILDLFQAVDRRSREPIA